MNQDSIDRWSRHIYDVPRIDASLEQLSDTEEQKLLESQSERVTTRWSLCVKSFKTLFMMLNRGGRFPTDSFDIRIKHEVHGETTYDTHVRVWRSKDHEQFYIKPYVTCGHTIYDYNFKTESFGKDYEYRFGTHSAHSAKFHITTDGIEPELQLTRVNGMLVDNSDNKHRAIYLSAIEGAIVPSLNDTEESLALIYTSLLDNNLNPELAERTKLRY